MPPQRIAVLATASGSGKTTLGRAVAAKLDAPFIELDALVHGPKWVETPDDVLRAKLAPIVASDKWVIDGNYRKKLGDLVLARAELVIWLDLSIRVWFPRLVKRTLQRAIFREELWNGNRESLRNAVWGRDSLFAFALLQYRTRRAEWPTSLAPFPYVRLRTPDEVDRFLREL